MVSLEIRLKNDRIVEMQEATEVYVNGAFENADGLLCDLFIAKIMDKKTWLIVRGEKEYIVVSRISEIISIISNKA